MFPKDFPPPNLPPFLGQWANAEEADRAAKTGKRYSRLQPLSMVEELQLAMMAVSFFSAGNVEHFRTELGLPTQPGQLLPLTGGDFMQTVKRHFDADILRRVHRVVELLRRLQDHGILLPVGTANPSAWPGLAQPLLCLRELTPVQREQTPLWLGPVLGTKFVASTIGTVVAHIHGRTSSGDQGGGSGILATRRAVITCAHVVSGLTLDGSLTIADKEVAVDSAVAHPEIDVGVIRLKEDATLPVGVAWGEPDWMEHIIAIGYAPVPGSTHTVITAQRGEVSGSFSAIDRQKYLLFSSIARPGDSGGPIVSMRGTVLGIVSQTAEQQGGPGLPFFAAVPSTEVRRAVSEIAADVTLLWESYD